MIIIILLIIVSGCDQKKENEIINNKYENIAFYEEEIPKSEWEDKLGMNLDDKVPTREAAIEIAEIIFKHLNHPKEKKQFEIYAVYFDESKNIWIVCYSHKDSEIVGDGYNIAINKTTGTIEKVWAEE